jgi:chemotaxis response regulator CheB
MPQAVVAAGLADEIVPLYDIPTAMMRFAEFCRRNDRP